MEARRAWHFFKTYSVIKDSAQDEELPRRLGSEGEGLINPVGVMLLVFVFRVLGSNRRVS